MIDLKTVGQKTSRKVKLRAAKDLWARADLEHDLALTYRGDDRMGMCAMYLADGLRFREIGNLVFCEELAEAFKMARGLDTLPRENVPDSFWRLFK